MGKLLEGASGRNNLYRLGTGLGRGSSFARSAVAIDLVIQHPELDAPSRQRLYSSIRTDPSYRTESTGEIRADLLQVRGVLNRCLAAEREERLKKEIEQSLGRLEESLARLEKGA